MAEIGLIFSVAGGAAKLSLALYRIADAIGTAGAEVRTFASNANALAQVLNTLSNAFMAREPVLPQAKTIADGLIALCQTILDDSNNLLKKLRPLVELTGSAQKRFILRVIWIFEKSKFATHVQSLESLKSTLALLVGTVNYSEGVASNKPRDIQISLRVQLQSIVVAVQNGNRGHQNVSRVMQRENRLLTQNPLEASRGSQSLHLQRTSNGSIDSEQDESQSTSPGLILHSTDEAPEAISTPETSIAVHSKNVEDEDEAEEEVEREFGIERLDVFAPYLEISLLQRRTIQFATRVLHVEEDGATAEDANAPNDQRPSNSQDGTRSSSSPPPPQFQMENMTGNIIYNSANPESLDQQQPVASSETTSVAAENAPTTKAEVSNVTNGILKFTDALGMKYALLLNDCQTWDGMVNILREIFREKNYWEYGLKSEVEKRNQSGRKYGLCPFILLGGPEYSIILPRHWAGIVHSEYSVTMRFEDPRLNGVPDPRVGLQRLVGKVGLWDKIVIKRRDAD